MQFQNKFIQTMINRNLIRIRVVQIVYAWYQNANRSVQNAEKTLMSGLQKSYDLYFYLLQLMVVLTRQYEIRIETKRNKFLPSEEDLHPNLHLVRNKFIRQLKENRKLKKMLSERPMEWDVYEIGRAHV